MTADGSGARRHRLSRGGLLARNTFLNVGAQLTVLLLAFIAVPILIGELGDARFGLLAIAWVVIGYAGIFDLGLGRALIALVGNRMGTGREHEVPVLFWTALATMLVAGTVGLAVLAALSPWIVGGILGVEDDLRQEATTAFVVLGCGLPFVVGSQALRSMLESEQRFDIVNGIRVPSSALSYFGPVVALQFWDGITVAVAMVVLSRASAFAVLCVMTLRAVPAVRESFAVSWDALKALLRFGGWVTLSGLVSPVLSNLDRVFVGAILSVSAVTYYATPHEVVRRMWIPSFAIAGVLFPAFALNHEADSPRAAKLFGAGNRAIFVTLFPIVLVVVAFAHEILTLWLGADFADRSETVMQLLAVGVFGNGLAQVAFGFVQSARPALSALIELAEVPLFVVAIVLLTRSLGIEGAAVAWAGRQLVDAAILHFVSGRMVPAARAGSRAIGFAALASLTACAAVTAISAVIVKIAVVAVLLAVFLAATWLLLLADDEKRAIRHRAAQLAPRPFGRAT